MFRRAIIARGVRESVGAFLSASRFEHTHVEALLNRPFCPVGDAFERVDELGREPRAELPEAVGRPAVGVLLQLLEVPQDAADADAEDALQALEDHRGLVPPLVVPDLEPRRHEPRRDLPRRLPVRLRRPAHRRRREEPRGQALGSHLEGPGGVEGALRLPVGRLGVEHGVLRLLRLGPRQQRRRAREGLAQAPHDARHGASTDERRLATERRGGRASGTGAGSSGAKKKPKAKRVQTSRRSDSASRVTVRGA